MNGRKLMEEDAKRTSHLYYLIRSDMRYSNNRPSVLVTEVWFIFRSRDAPSLVQHLLKGKTHYGTRLRAISPSFSKNADSSSSYNLIFQNTTNKRILILIRCLRLLQVLWRRIARQPWTRASCVSGSLKCYLPKRCSSWRSTCITEKG